MATTTKQQFALFKEEVWKWLRYFHLGSWDVDILLEPTDGEAGLCGCDYVQKYARIILADNLNFDDESAEGKQLYVKKIAFHEVCELLLGEIRLVADSRYATPEMINNSIHGVISRLTNTIFKEAKHGNR
jgi:hypothetical protein